MIRVVVAVMDKKAGVFATPWFVQSSGVAIRTFRDEVKRVPGGGQDGNQLNAHPEDFELWQLTTFDDNTGQFGEEGPRLLIAAKDCVE